MYVFSITASLTTGSVILVQLVRPPAEGLFSQEPAPTYLNRPGRQKAPPAVPHVPALPAPVSAATSVAYTPVATSADPTPTSTFAPVVTLAAFAPDHPLAPTPSEAPLTLCASRQDL
ncbi:hypothetical protein FDENT_1554 [Fusarium denticulatum]|uniref:Uncharacterized protein n=1 Tax=Fusarium denticulatum TaxID=48507 RepID=A0A8H5XIP3_9HYPO|nr:hypothetical protein FDENT_1554 [Fusarium denticulatum]